MGAVRSAALLLTAALAVLGVLAPAAVPTGASGSPPYPLIGLAQQEAWLVLETGVAPGSHYGSSVAVSGDIAVVGVRDGNVAHKESAGYAHAFVRIAGVWTEEAILIAPDAQDNDYLGTSVAISGDTIVVGAPGDHTGIGGDAGSAYVFVRTASGWSLQEKLTAIDATAYAYFGTSVAISGDTIVVGSRLADSAYGEGTGAAYIFVRTDGMWTEQQKLAASDAAAGDYFGYSVAVSGDTTVVGAQCKSAGAAYIFVRSDGTWAEQEKLTSSDAAPMDSFGISVAISGDTAVVGAHCDDTAAGIDAGSAYVFVRTDGTWAEQQKLTASDAAATDLFGLSVAVSGDTAVVGAPHPDFDSDAGSAYAFACSDGTWAEREKLTASNAAPYDHFGTSVAISGYTAVVGAPYHDTGPDDDSGSAYAFLLDATSPVTTAALTPAANAAGWNARPVMVSLSATDDWNGVASTEYREAGDPSWTAYAGPFPVSAQGISIFEYRSSDVAGNLETPQTLVVQLDSQRPVTKAYAATVRRGRRVKLAYRISDLLPGCTKAKVTLRLYKGHRLKKTIDVRRLCICNTKTICSWRCTLAKGRYTLKVYAKDIAGNAQRRVGSASLTVR